MVRRSTRIRTKAIAESNASSTSSSATKKTRAKSTRRASSRSSPSPDETFVYEFGGPVGAVSTSIALPLVCYGFTYLCDQNSCPNMDKVSALLADPLGAATAGLHAFPAYCTFQGFAVVLGWFLFQLILERCLPGPIGQGTELKEQQGARLKYSLNGHAAYWTSIVLVFLWQTISVCQTTDGEFFNVNGIAVCSTLKRFPLQLTSMSWLEVHFIELLTASLICSSGMSLVLYIHSLRFAKGHPEVAHGGDSGVAVYDFFMGRELNPRPVRLLLGGVVSFSLFVVVSELVVELIAFFLCSF